MMPPPTSPFPSVFPTLLSNPQHNSKGRHPLPDLPSLQIPDGISRPSSIAFAFGDSVQSNYEPHIDPFQASGESHAVRQEEWTSVTTLLRSPILSEKSRSDAAPSQISDSAALEVSKSFLR